VHIPSTLMLFSDDCSDTTSNIPREGSAFVEVAESVAAGDRKQNIFFKKEILVISKLVTKRKGIYVPSCDESSTIELTSPRDEC